MTTWRIVGATLIDGSGRPPVRDAVVQITGARVSGIWRLGDEASAEGPAYDGHDLFIVPGLIDAHVHVAISPDNYADADDPPAVSAALLESFVHHGVTTVRDPGTPDFGAFDAELRRGRPEWPRFFGSGPVLDGAPGIQWGGTRIIGSPGEARAQVADLAASGADLIKIYHWMTPPLARAVVRAAHELGLAVALHPGTLTAGQAVRLGVDQIEHLLIAPELLDDADRERAAVLPERAWASLDGFRLWRWVNPTSRRARSLVELLVERRAFLVPTVVLSRAVLVGHDPVVAERTGVARMPPEVRARWTRTAERDAHQAPVPGEAAAILRRQLDFVSLAHRQGVSIAAGTGGLGHELVPGASLHEELGLLVEAGLTPLAAIVAGTSRGAALLGRARDLGTVERAKIADLVLVRADPLVDIANLARIAAVVKDGEIVAGSLDRLPD